MVRIRLLLVSNGKIELHSAHVVTGAMGRTPVQIPPAKQIFQGISAHGFWLSGAGNLHIAHLAKRRRYVATHMTQITHMSSCNAAMPQGYRTDKQTAC